jgi:Cu(I)/Ag(I) efflux system membrane fusion protein
MKRNLRNKSYMYTIVGLLILTSCRQDVDHSKHADTYTCPMHPTVVSDNPGTCPVCGMELVRKARPSEEVEISGDLARLLESPNESVVSSIKTIKGQYKSLPVSVGAYGVVTYDTRKIYTIPARVGGRLERIFLKYQFQPILKGEKIAEIYSPELITGQRELIFLLENDPENKSLIESAARKVELLGMSNSQINELTKTREASNTVGVYSPYSGYLITGQPEPPGSRATQPEKNSGGAEMSDGMGATSLSSMANSQSESADPRGSIVREGDYVRAGQTLFTVVNSDALRIELNLPGSYSGIVKEGQRIVLDMGNNVKDIATVDFIQPFFTEGQEFMKVRVYTDKTADLHIGHLVNATISLDAREALWVPKEAILDLGTKKILFLKDRDVLRPKLVVVGMAAEGLIEVKSGLASSDEIAANAQYLVDSESFIKPLN